MRLNVQHCHNCEGYHLECNDVTLATSQSEGVCLRMARILEEASNRPSREAMKLLKDEIGFEDHHALDILAVLHGGARELRTLQ